MPDDTNNPATAVRDTTTTAAARVNTALGIDPLAATDELKENVDATLAAMAANASDAIPAQR